MSDSNHDNCPGCGNPIDDEEHIATSHLSDIIISAMEYAALNGDSMAIVTALTTTLGMYVVQFGEDPDTIIDVLQSAIQHFEIMNTEQPKTAKEPVQPS